MIGEKRFQVTTKPMSKSVAFDEKEKRHYIGVELEDLLNELSDENGQLKEENEQLRQFINKGRRLSVKELIDNTNENELLKKKIMGLEKKNEKLRQMIKANVLKQYRDGSLADLEFKAIAYDDIVKVKLSYESEPKVIVYCKYGKRHNIMSFCQMFIPFGVAFEIKEVVDYE